MFRQPGQDIIKSRYRFTEISQLHEDNTLVEVCIGILRVQGNGPVERRQCIIVPPEGFECKTFCIVCIRFTVIDFKGVRQSP